MKEPQIIQGSGAERSYVVAGAKLKCSYAVKKRKLRLPFSHGVYVKDKALMNVMDYKPNKNIVSFGICKSPKNPNAGSPHSCKPKITMKWINGKEDMLVENQPALINICKNKCAYEGEITIVEDGQ